MIRCYTLVAALFALASTQNAFAQFDSGFGQPTASTPDTLPDGPYWVQSSDLLVVMPETRKIVAGYSIEIGTWDRVEFKDPLPKEVVIVVGGNAAAFQTEDSIYAFSSITSTWARLQVPKTEQTFYLDSSIVKYETKDELYLFSVKTGEWSGTSKKTGKELRVR